MKPLMHMCLRLTSSFFQLYWIQMYSFHTLQNVTWYASKLHFVPIGLLCVPLNRQLQRNLIASPELWNCMCDSDCVMWFNLDQFKLINVRVKWVFLNNCVSRSSYCFLMFNKVFCFHHTLRDRNKWWAPNWNHRKYKKTI